MSSLTKKILCATAMASIVACSVPEFRPRSVGSLPGAMNGEELLAEGRMQYRQGNFALAVNAFRRAMRQAPESVDAYNGLAASYDRLGRFDLARRYYEEALAIAPADPRVRANYAVSLRMQGLNEQAALLEQAHVAGPPPAQVAAALGPPPALTIELPPARAESVPRLERMSMGEVALITRPETRGPTTRQAARPGEALPIRLVRDTGRQLVWELGPTPAPARTVARTQILNGVGRRGQAARMERHLRTLGWDRTSIADSAVRPQRSVILAPAALAGEAEALAGTLPFRPRVLRAAAAGQLVLVLGRDAVPFDRGLIEGRARS